MQKYRLLRDYLLGEHIVSEPELRLPTPASRAELELTHTPEYVEAFLSGTLDPRMVRRIGIPWSEAFVRRTLASTGGTIAAARVALHDGFAGNLAGGTHHAFAAAGEGFCVFNDIAVALGVLVRDRAIQRAAVVDLDVHQGNGTADIFTGRSDIYTLSLHGKNNYPFTKIPSTRDVALPDHCRDEEYLEALREEFDALRKFGPDIIFYQGGVDVLEADTLGRLDLSPEGVMERDRLVCELAVTLGVPLVATLGGGYAKPIEKTVQAHAGTYRVFRRYFS
jgi:acetoin utilization deacetylase AcuC-like enzyme